MKFSSLREIMFHGIMHSTEPTRRTSGANLLVSRTTTGEVELLSTEMRSSKMTSVVSHLAAITPTDVGESTKTTEASGAETKKQVVPVTATPTVVPEESLMVYSEETRAIESSTVGRGSSLTPIPTVSTDNKHPSVDTTGKTILTET